MAVEHFIHKRSDCLRVRRKVGDLQVQKYFPHRERLAALRLDKQLALQQEKARLERQRAAKPTARARQGTGVRGISLVMRPGGWAFFVTTSKARTSVSVGLHGFRGAWTRAVDALCSAHPELDRDQLLRKRPRRRD